MISFNKLDPHFAADVESIGRISAVSSILEVVCRSTGMGFAAVARVTEDKWIACAVQDEIQFGLLPGGELKVETTICHEIRESKKVVAIDHVAENEIYCQHHTPAMYGFQSYISVPITLKNGKFFGTLCAIDPRPAKVENTATINMFNLFAELIALHLDALDEMDISKKNLLEERSSSNLREQFIAILGHDLRNPVGASLASAQLLLQMPLDDQAHRLAAVIQNSSFRMNGLIENILDFASGRLGQGIVLKRQDHDRFDAVLDQIIAELRVIWPGKQIQTQFDLLTPVNADSNRIAQLFSNLLSNALSYGSPSQPIVVKAISNKSGFVLSVTNASARIPDKVLQRLFQPFYRGEIASAQKGLGLGLYIASEIAAAHNGTLTVDSTDEHTSFTLIIPH